MAMLDAVAAGRAGASALLWAARAPGLVLPERFSREPGFVTAAADCAAAGWPVATRKTGGGITPQGPGVLNLALAFRAAPGRSRTIRDGYDAICAPLTEAMDTLGIAVRAAPVRGSFCDGDFNLAVAGRKLVGTAQRWRGGACLVHALILVDIELAPAVAAVQRLSAGLGHDAVFDPRMHCRLTDLAGNGGTVPAAADRIWHAVRSRGYAPWQSAN